VKNELVATNGIVALVSGSVFGAKTLKVAHPSSIFSTLNTVDVSVSVGSLLIGIASGVLQHPHKYKVIGLVLQFKLVVEHPKKPLSHVSKQDSPQLAFC
jgi:hypothetical protein